MFRSAVALSQATRGYATASQAVKAPIQVHGLAGRYAHALYAAAAKKQALNEVEKELMVVKTMVAANPVFRDFLHNAALQRSEKQAGINAIFKKGRFSALTTDFFDIIASNNRLTESGPIIDAFLTIMRAERKEVAATAYSAKPLSASDKTALSKQLNRFLQSGETLVLDTKVDASLIGGLVVELGDKRIDLSVATKIKQITASLRQVV